MGFRTAAVVVPTCFLLGKILMLAWRGLWLFVIRLIFLASGVLLTGLASADWPILYSGKGITPADLDRAETYYVTLWHAPGAVPALLHAMVRDMICFLPWAWHRCFVIERSPTSFPPTYLGRSCPLGAFGKASSTERDQLFL